MVCGYDVLKESKSPVSVDGFVSSTNSNFTRYASSVEMSENVGQVSSRINVHMTKALK